MLNQDRKDMKNDKSRLAYTNINLKWQGDINSEKYILFRCFSCCTYTAPNANSRSTLVIAIIILYFTGKIVKSVVKS
jgi:hypothetical protein